MRGGEGERRVKDEERGIMREEEGRKGKRGIRREEEKRERGSGESER